MRPNLLLARCALAQDDAHARLRGRPLQYEEHQRTPRAARGPPGRRGPSRGNGLTGFLFIGMLPEMLILLVSPPHVEIGSFVFYNAQFGTLFVALARRVLSWDL